MEPARPARVPEGARFAAEPIPHWHDGRLEPGSGQPLGLHTYFTVHGEPMRYERYDERGRRLVRRSALQPDWVFAQIEAFRKEPCRFDWYTLPEHVDEATLDAFDAVARAGGPTHRSGWAEALAFLDQRRGRNQTITFSRADRVLALFRDTLDRRRDDAPEIGALLRDPDEYVFVALALEAMVTLGDEAGLARWGRRWLEAPPASKPYHRHPKDLASRLQGALEGRWDQAPVARAGRRLGAVVRGVLGDGEKTPLLLVDAKERVYWLDGDDVVPAPLEVDATGPSLAPWFGAGEGSRSALPALSTRELSVSAGRGFWLLQRYGRDLLLFGGARDLQTLAVEPVVDLFVRCPDDGWADRIAALFAASRPFAGEATDGFEESPGVSWIREYAGDIHHVAAHDVRWLGVAGSDLVGATTPLPKAELFARPPKPSLPVLGRFGSSADRASALRAFEAEERALFERGYALVGLHRADSIEKDR